MKFVLEQKMKRGDAFMYRYNYLIKFVYLHPEEKEIKKSEVTAYGIFPNAEKELKEWFHNSYPKYEVTNIEFRGEY